MSNWILITFVVMHGGTCGQMLHRVDAMSSREECLAQRDRISESGEGRYLVSCQDIASNPIFVNLDRNGKIKPSTEQKLPIEDVH